MWTRTFRCTSWIFRKGRGTEIKVPTSVGSQKKHESSRKTSTLALLTMPKPLTVWITTNCGKFFKRWEYQNTYRPPEKPVCRSRGNNQNPTLNNRLVPNWERSMSRLSLCLFNLYAEDIMLNSGLDEAWGGMKITRRNVNNFKYSDDTTLMAESEEELKSLLKKVKEESKKVGLIQQSKKKNHGIWSHYFMANRWGNHGNNKRLYSFGLQNHCRSLLQSWN